MAKKSNGTVDTAETILEVPVEYGNLNVGDDAISVKINVSRSALSLAKADKIFCGHRLTMSLYAQEDGADPDQGALPGMDCLMELTGIMVDSKSFHVKTKTIGIGLTFSRKDVDVGQLAKFAKKPGKVVVEAVAELPVKGQKDGDDDDDDGDDE